MIYLDEKSIYNKMLKELKLQKIDELLLYLIEYHDKCEKQRRNKNGKQTRTSKKSKL